MKRYVKMTPEQFAGYLLQYKWETGKCVEFALADESVEDTQDYTAWWFCTNIFLPQYNSDTLLIDYCGGGFPHAFPTDDEELFKLLIVEYFTKFNDDWNEQDGINVEIED